MTHNEFENPGHQYDEIGSVYREGKRDHFQQNFAPDVASQFIARTLPRSRGALLDVGCGEGGALNTYRKSGFIAHGVDPSSKSVDAARLHLKDEHVASVGTWDNLRGILDASQDVLVGRFSLHYCPDIDAAFREVFRVLKPGGDFIFLIPNPADDVPDESLTKADGRKFVSAELFRGTAKPVTIRYPYHESREYDSDVFKNLFSIQHREVSESTARKDSEKGNRILAVHAKKL